MALDRFVYWDEEKPSITEVVETIRCYLGGVGSIDEITQHKDAYEFYISLPGKGTHPLEWKRPELAETHRPDRWIEIYMTDKYIDVITRNHDDFTNKIADGFASSFERFWQGKWERNG